MQLVIKATDPVLLRSKYFASFWVRKLLCYEKRASWPLNQGCAKVGGTSLHSFIDFRMYAILHRNYSYT